MKFNGKLKYMAVFLIVFFTASFLLLCPAGAKEKPKSDKKDIPKPVQTEEELPVKEDNVILPGKEDKTDFTLPQEVLGEKVQLVTAVIIEGNDKIPAEEIKNILITKQGDPVLEPKLVRDRRAIMDMGYFSDVNYSQENFGDGVKIIFRVMENPVVNKISVSGNKIVATDKILSLMETAPGKILNNKTLSADLAAIRNYYDEDLGYMLPNHVEDISWTPDGEIILKIKEAMPISQIIITGNKSFSESALKNLMKMKAGDLFNRKILTKDITALFEFYKERDYYINIQQPQIDFEKGIINIDVAEVVVEDIQVSGNEKTKTSFIKKILKMKPGSKLRNADIMRDHKMLQDLQLFDSIEPDTEQGSAPDKYVVIWKVKEPKKYNFFTFGVGYGGGGATETSRSGLTGGIIANVRNLKGEGQSVSANWQRGSNIDSWSASFYNPAINARADQFGFSLFNSTYTGLRQPVENTNPVIYSYYDDHRAGGSCSFGRWIGPDLRASLGLRREQVGLNRNVDSQYDPLGMKSGSLNAVSLSGVYDTRDDVFNPYKGNYISSSAQFTGGVFRGSYTYGKYQGEVRKHFPLKKERSVALRLWGGAIGGAPPALEYFYIGGVDTIRAYEDNSLFGTRMVVANAEYRFPIGKIDLLKGAVFADAGNAWFSGDQNLLIKKDVGVGLRLAFQKIGLAVGIIRIDYAMRGQGQSRFSIGMGQSF